MWFDTVSDYAVDMLLGTLFFDRFIRNILSIKCKVVSRHPHLGAILSISHHRKLTMSQRASLISKSQRSKRVKESSIPVCSARQVVLAMHAQQTVLETTSAPPFYTVMPKALKKGMKLLSVAYGAIDTLS